MQKGIEVQQLVSLDEDAAKPVHGPVRTVALSLRVKHDIKVISSNRIHLNEAFQTLRDARCV